MTSLSVLILLVILLLAQVVQRTSAAHGDSNDGTPDINAPHPSNNNPSGPQPRSVEANVTSNSTEPGVLLGRIDFICIIGGDESCMAVCVNQGGSMGICDYMGCLCYI